MVRMRKTRSGDNRDSVRRAPSWQPSSICVSQCIVALTIMILSINVYNLKNKNETTILHKPKNDILNAKPTFNSASRTDNPTENSLGIAKTESSENTCEIVTPVFANRTSTALASYPGSGNTMTRVLIEALTGVWTGSTHGNPLMLGKQSRSVGNPADDRLTENVVVVKTHQPGKVGYLRWKGATRVILIVRNPLDAIPSSCNAKWEIGSATVMHTEQMPEKYWIVTRDRRFEFELKMWRTMIDFWTKRFDDPDNSMIVIYEDLINVETGPAIAAEMMTFLGHGIIPLESVPCIWQKVVRGSAEKVHRTRRYKPSFLRKQLDQIIGNLTEISQNYKHEPTIERATSLYLDIAKERLN
mmetsp:Transcript_36105/g.84337  ORF Transcript_36105/g.84337 Transcript_36105/m.84337 type:complete len:357 (-) Transcript_36105:222-1292(-)